MIVKMKKISHQSDFSPAPRPKWFHNGVEINENNDDGFRFEGYGKTLVIFEIIFELKLFALGF